MPKVKLNICNTTAPGVRGEVLGVYRDAARSSGGAEELEEQKLHHRNSSTLPPHGTLPNGEGIRIACVCIFNVFVCLRVSQCAFHAPPFVFLLQDSLAAEIEGTMRKELSLDDPECEEQK